LELEMAHKKLFDQLNIGVGPARAVLGLDQIVERAFDHVIKKIAQQRISAFIWKAMLEELVSRWH